MMSIHVYELFLLAIANLSGVMLYGKKIHVTLSKHTQVQMPQAGSNVSSSLTLGARRRRVTVLVLCVCLSVDLCICYHSRGGIVNLYTRTKLLTALLRYTLHFQLVDFDKNASFRSYGVVCYSAGAI